MSHKNMKDSMRTRTVFKGLIWRNYAVSCQLQLIFLVDFYMCGLPSTPIERLLCFSSVLPLGSYDSSLHASSRWVVGGGSDIAREGFYRVLPTPTSYIVDRLE